MTDDNMLDRMRSLLPIGSPKPVAHTGTGATPIDAIVAALRHHKR